VKRGIISKTIIKKLSEADIDGISIEELAMVVYKKNNKIYQLRIIKNIGLLRIRKGLDIKYDKNNRRYFLFGYMNRPKGESGGDKS